MRNVKVKMFAGTLFQVEESVNAFLGEEDSNGWTKHTLEYATLAVEGEKVFQAIFYTDD
jgi:hypothetical protein